MNALSRDCSHPTERADDVTDEKLGGNLALWRWRRRFACFGRKRRQRSRARVWRGVYTEEQDQRGEPIYARMRWLATATGLPAGNLATADGRAVSRIGNGLTR